jgi:hypothetical protein
MEQGNKALVELWKNDDRRREFLKNYRAWSVWITTPELGLTYYRYDLPEGSKILAMEYQNENSYRHSDENEYQTITHYYLWTDRLFTPHFSSENEIVECLKKLKVGMQKELRADKTEG